MINYSITCVHTLTDRDLNMIDRCKKGYLLSIFFLTYALSASVVTASIEEGQIEHALINTGFKRFDFNKTEVVMPGRNIITGFLSPLSQSNSLHYRRGTRTIAGDFQSKFLFINVIFGQEKKNGYITPGIFDIEGDRFYPVFIKGDPPDKPLHQGDLIWH